MSSEAPPSVIDRLFANAAADNEALLKNNTLGDVFDCPRDVDFVFKCPDPMRAHWLCDFLQRLNYASASVSQISEGEWRVTAYIHMPINQPLICSVSALMVFLAGAFGVEYDGWGSRVQNG
jgi:hypothetical protein